MKTLIYILPVILLVSCSMDKFEEFSVKETQSTNTAPIASETLRASDDGLSILTYNMVMIPVDGDFNSAERAKRFAQADFIDNYDVIVFQELIDKKPVELLLQKLQSKFPYQTKVMGGDKSGWDKTLGAYYPFASKIFLTGGVAIVSKYPITQKVQYVFSNATGWDYSANKGFVHARIEKAGQVHNVLGTHLNATHAKGLPYETKRKQQIKEMKKYIDKLPKNEMVVMAGDFNIIKGTEEYANMLKALDVSEPNYIGLDYTFVKENQISAYRYSDFSPEYLDYILVSNNHLQPENWYNVAFAPVFEKSIFSAAGHSFYDISDHYPVGAFVRANKNYEKKDTHYRKYDNVRFRHLETKKLIRMKEINGAPTNMLVVDQMNPTTYSTFNILSQNADGDYNNVKSDEYVNIESSVRRYKYWKPNKMEDSKTAVRNDFSKNLKLIIIDAQQQIIPNKPLETGDLVVFRDVDENNNEAYLTRMQGTSTLRLYDSRITNECIFRVELNPESQKTWEFE